MQEQHYQQSRRTRDYPDESRRQQGSWDGGRQGQYRPGEYGQYGEQGSYEDQFESQSRYGRQSGQSGQYGGQSGQYGGQSGQYGGQSGQYGGQSGQYGGQSEGQGQFGGQYEQSRSRPDMGRGYSSEYSQHSRPGHNRGESSQYGGAAGQYGQSGRGSYRGDEFRPDSQSYGESEMYGSMSSQPWFNQSSYGGYAGYGAPSYGGYGGYGGGFGGYGGYGGGEGRYAGGYGGYGGGGMGSEQRDRGWSGQHQPYGSGGSGMRENREAGGGQYGGFGQGGGSTRSLGTRSYGKPPKNFQRSGDRIREEIAEQLMREPSLDASDVEIQVRGSEVMLEGTVPERWMKRQIEDIAEYAMGVEDVENHIRVKRQSGSQTQTGGNREEESESGSAGRSTGKSSTGSTRGATSISGSAGRNT